jgi:Lanthionine synthetase C-like protein
MSATVSTLYDPQAHERLVEDEWDEERARAAIQSIVNEAVSAIGLQGHWPVHPLDVDPADPDVHNSVYMGSAGMLWAMASLAATGAADVPLDLTADIEGIVEAYRASPDFGESAGLWVGETGVVMAAYAITGHMAHAERALELARSNLTSDTNEVMWGTPGTTLAMHHLYRRTGDERFNEVWAEGAERIFAQWGEEGLWTQHLYGKVARMLGPAHGFAGNVRVLAQGGDMLEAVRVRATPVVELNAVREGKLVNWPAEAGLALDARQNTIRTQWCHGAPGMVATLWDLAPEELMVGGGELTWTAGPLAKGPGFCHGTAGNGYAFLKLHALTGDDLWLDRARAFAMHAIGQVEHMREEHGQGRYTLFTGDAGVALYVRGCIEADPDVPTIDYW